MGCMLIFISSIMRGEGGGHRRCTLFVQSQGDFLLASLGPLLHGEIMRNGGGGSLVCGAGGCCGGGRQMSRGVNIETGVWQGTMIRFISQPMLFSLLGDCCKTLSANRHSQRPTAETLLAPSPSPLPGSSPPSLSHIACVPSTSASPLPLPLPPLPQVRLDLLPRGRP